MPLATRTSSFDSPFQTRKCLKKLFYSIFIRVEQLRKGRERKSMFFLGWLSQDQSALRQMTVDQSLHPDSHPRRGEIENGLLPHSLLPRADYARGYDHEIHPGEEGLLRHGKTSSATTSHRRRRWPPVEAPNRDFQRLPTHHLKPDLTLQTKFAYKSSPDSLSATPPPPSDTAAAKSTCPVQG